MSYRRNAYDGKNVFVAHISLVKGTPFYGFHVGYKFYFKIYLLNPLNMTRLADLLREGAVMKMSLQPYESHMQYLAQWMCDYNLYGCAYIDCRKVKFRDPIPPYLDLDNDLQQWHDRTISSDLITDENVLPKQSHCPLEADVCAQDILNRQDVTHRPLHQDFAERLHPIPLDVKLVQSMAGLWKDETHRRKRKLGLLEPNSSPFPPEVMISMSADPRNSQPGGWIHEDEFRDKVAELVGEEFRGSNMRPLDFDTFVGHMPFEDSVKTALESVEDLYPQNLSLLQLNGTPLPRTNDKSNQPLEDVQVDESRIRNLDKNPISANADGNFSALADRSDEDAAELAEDEGYLIPNRKDQTALKLHSGSPSSGTDHSSENSNAVQTPVSSSEFAAIGIRRAGDFENIEADAFEIPADSTSYKKGIKARTDTLSDPHAHRLIPRKRKLLIDEDEIEFKTKSEVLGVEDRNILEFAQDAGSQRLGDSARYMGTLVHPDTLSQLSAGTQNSMGSQVVGSQKQPQLCFPVVKDPHDANTISRLSQTSASSRKPSQSKTSQSSESPMRPRLSTETGSRDTGSGLDSPAIEGKYFGNGDFSSTYFPPVTKVHSGSKLLFFRIQPPRQKDIQHSLSENVLPLKIYQDAFYSEEGDVPDRQREYAGKEFKLESNTILYLPNFESDEALLAAKGQKTPLLVDHQAEDNCDRRLRRQCKIQKWNVSELPPSQADVEDWLAKQTTVATMKGAQMPETALGHLPSQIDAPTQKNKHGFKYSQKQASTSVQHETQYMSILSLEVHVNSRGSLAPDPEKDEVACIFWSLHSDDEHLEVNGTTTGTHIGILCLAEEPGLSRRIGSIVPVIVEEESSELDLLTKMADIVRHFDPDVLTGYEVHNSSWGYLIERARVKYDYDLCDEFSRMKSQSHGRFGKDNDRWGFNHTSTIRVTGRHMINIWRAMRGELNLLQYTMENVVFHLLHRRIPHYSFADLTSWYTNTNPRHLAKVVNYFVSRVQMDLEILETNELVPRTSEQARLLGVDFFSVFSRGSQFKVESLMFRIAKPENFLLVSPSRRQVGGQNALECLPLVMEPQSNFYTSPMLVLDFQSLYPSVMIAYNYCYSTFLGRIVSWQGQNKMGFTTFQRQQRLLELLKDEINVAPNGMMYAKTAIRKSLLAKMLSEILETRVMVKSGMKADKDDKTLQRLLNNRQLALKLIANVTYGYTSASFSGRMPCSEIADSIVQTGRETLEKAIALIHSVERWNAEVVYGDTDSLFVYLKGRTREQAFDIGEEIAATITKMNPRPVKLKFEKVYHPCVLLAKKRYVGFKYESRNQTSPDFDAKGIETVRRDGTPAEQKIEEKALKTLFHTADLSQVKAYFQSQCAKIMAGKVSIQDFCFAKEVKLGTYSDKGPPPPGALISARRMAADHRLEPQYGDRVPYVVVTGGPGARLIDRCVAPEVLMRDPSVELDAEYYISKNMIPPLERIFNLVGANVRSWYDEMPKLMRVRRIEGVTGGAEKKTLESYMKASNCVMCRNSTITDTELPLCGDCAENVSSTVFNLRRRLKKAERKVNDMHAVCRSCAGLTPEEDVRCDSKDCAVFYSRGRSAAEWEGLRRIEGETVGGLERRTGLDQSCFDW